MNESPQKLQVVLADAKTAGRLTVDLGAFFHFNHQMNQRLKAMVDKWSHLAAPRAILRDRHSEDRADDDDN